MFCFSIRQISSVECLSLARSLKAMDGPRRSSRKREEKSYAESPDFIIEEALLAGSKQERATNHVTKEIVNNSVVVSNGDVEMESDDDDDAELPPLPLPKVRITANLRRPLLSTISIRIVPHPPLPSSPAFNFFTWKSFASAIVYDDQKTRDSASHCLAFHT